MKHFKLRLDLKKEIYGVKLYQIEALKDLALHNVKQGQLGGYVESESNLSDNAWVYGNARVYGNAWISGNAQVSGNARVYGNAWISGNAQVSGNARVYGNAWISGNAQVSGNALVSGNARVCDNARVFGDAQVSGNARVSQKMIVKSIKDLVHIIYLKYSITISLTGINIGCKHYKTHKQYKELSPKDGADNNYTDFDMKFLDVTIKNALKYIKKTSK